MPSSPLTTAFPGPAQLLLPAASRGPTPASQQPFWTQHPASSQQPLEAQNFLKSSSPGPAQASRWSLQEAQLLPRQSLQAPNFIQVAPLGPTWASRLTFCLPVACTDPALAGEQPQQAPHLCDRDLSRPDSHLTVASRDQVPVCLPPGSLDRPSASHTMACFGPADASRGPPRALSGPASCLTVDPSGQAPALRQPLQAQLLPPSGLYRPSSCLNSGLYRPSICCIASSPGPALPPVGISSPGSSSRWPLQAQVALKSASLGPAPASLQPL
ncbi:LOW QUALITY PROTEIN: putative uncharacterized protein FLJ46235 [Trachypithecus francoisi]|uniref:LOW QUALITY PROTEIN: putative uncharacterized protein FLJ46235 n=1 Tax=Trachypithecus francoisi TaxID=54180 RepID=UPI00141B7C80|nr:LOW QUALITY PROTEIN: putative uncharacterized protein FLJ46235 [Trachypithecus francoisi]